VLHGMHIGATWQIRLSRPCAVAMRPFSQITLSTCYTYLYFWHYTFYRTAETTCTVLLFLFARFLMLYTVPVCVYARVLYFYRCYSRHATDWASDLRSRGHDFDCRSWRGCVCASITQQYNVVAVMNGDALRPGH